LKKKNKGFRNKDPRYFEKLAEAKKKLRWFFIKESKKKLGVENDLKRKDRS
tara:strand:- start:7423 stop:7575 length:153 start_codon:yes stop_codon:yes gene_type:complete